MNKNPAKKLFMMITIIIVVYLGFGIPYLMKKYQYLDANGQILSRTIDMLDPFIIFFWMILIIWIINLIVVIAKLGSKNNVETSKTNEVPEDENFGDEIVDDLDEKVVEQKEKPKKDDLDDKKKKIKEKSERLKGKKDTGKKSIKRTKPRKTKVVLKKDRKDNK